MSYKALAFYSFIPIENPHAEVEKHTRFLGQRDAAGRIYISEEGINAQLSGENSAIEAYIAWIREDERFLTVRFQVQAYEENIFPRMTIKYRRQLVAIDQKIDLSKRGEHLDPRSWRACLEKERGKHFLMDVRNQYEWKIGHFEGAALPPLEQFRDFPSYARELKESLSPKTKILMYCTGGIRCEIFSSLLKEEGFESVYQLEGGVIHYGLKEGGAHWKGKLFVFDDRLAIPLEEARTISACLHCGSSSDTYYNCANMDCNELFLSCETCIMRSEGCCSNPCQLAPRTRSFDQRQGNKPFRRKHLLGLVK